MLLNHLPLDSLPIQAVSIAADVVLIALPSSVGELRLPFESRPPFGTVQVESHTDSFQIAALRLPDSMDRDPVETSPGADVAILQMPPVIFGADVADFAAELAPASRLRLLGFLLGFCRRAFDLGTEPDFASVCGHLARSVTPEIGMVEPVATVTSRWIVLSGLRPSDEAAIWSINPRRVRRQTLLRPQPEGSLYITERLSPGDLILALGEQPGIWTVASVREGFRDLLHPQPEAEALRLACLRVLAPECPAVAASIRELSLLSPAAPIRHDDLRRPIGAALEAALADGDGRMFLRGWIHDPLDMVASADLCGFAGTTSVAMTDLHRFHRPDLEKKLAGAAFTRPGARAGFVSYPSDPASGLSLQPTLVLRLHSGAPVAIRPPLHMLQAVEARAAILTSVPPVHVTDAMLDSCIGPAAAAFHRLTLRDCRTPDLIKIGRGVANPHTSIIVPLYRNLSFLRFQIAALASDPTCAGAELIYVLDSPEQRAEAEHLLRGFHAMYGISTVLLVMPRNLGYAAANNAGAAAARAPTLLLLNSDIVPDQPNWLQPLHEALAVPGVGAAGPKLLFDDESIQHAGLYFLRDVDGMWLNAHYYKGMPRHWPAADIAREVPGLTGAAILVHRALFEAVGGICEDYIIGDYEDSDFCLRLREAGHMTVYVPTAELFHFERRSISLHKGYAGTLACRYNRSLHHKRWDPVITELLGGSAEPALLLTEDV